MEVVAGTVETADREAERTEFLSKDSLEVQVSRRQVFVETEAVAMTSDRMVGWNWDIPAQDRVDYTDSWL